MISTHQRELLQAVRLCHFYIQKRGLPWLLLACCCFGFLLAGQQQSLRPIPTIL